MSIEDVDDEGPFAAVQPNAGCGSTADDGDARSVSGESDILHIDPTIYSVCERDRTGLRGSEGRNVGGTCL